MKHFPINNQISLFKSLNEVFDFRQPLGGQATRDLVKFLQDYTIGDDNNKYVNAYAVSSINSPNELFDKFGRVVCDIFVFKDKEEDGKNLNHWLVKNGWTFPDFYDSMSNEEITTLRTIGNEADIEKRGIRPFHSSKLVELNYNLLFDKDNASNIVANDNGMIN